ncbi:hypothetical protein FN846DRAFT_914518 [Sphaerosporella brunnea]|uniref:Protein kinase domain-containing protein n=1 Tax=Sphaerosporella brunnea TaxID=1250544 RepID=A0A5J5EC01_9PEZI|nr:hypothetical protein FN846DRAFT_914518 [Sphaerosporella brunnea]
MKLKLTTEHESFAAERAAFPDERTAFTKEQTALAQERIEWEKTKSHLEKALLAERAAHKVVKVKLSPHLQSNACIITLKANVWNQGISKKRVSSVEKQLPPAAVALSRAGKQRALMLQRKSSLRAEADLYEPVCALLSSLITKTQGSVIDTHDTAYLKSLKPDITVCAPMITRVHGAYAQIIMELKSRGVALDASCCGQLLNYMYAQAKMQPFRTRFTGLLSNIDENVSIVMEQKSNGSTHAWSYARVRFDRAVEFLVALMFDDSETPLHPHFSSGLGKIQQHLGMSTNNVVASFRLRKPPQTDGSWYWTDVGLEAGKKQEILVKRSTVRTKPTPLSDEIGTLKAIAAMPGDRCPYLPTLLFATHDGKEYGILPVGRPLDPVTLNQTPEHTRQILRDVLAGMDWLHERGWLHRDIRWDNIVLDSEGRAMLVDLGGATMLNEVCGEYMGGDDYHAMVLLVNTLLFPCSQRGFNSGNIGFSTLGERKRLCELWQWLTATPDLGPYVVAAQNGDRKKLDDLPYFVGALDASPLCCDELGVFDAPGVICDSVDGPDAGGETSDDDDELCCEA